MTTAYKVLEKEYLWKCLRDNPTGFLRKRPKFLILFWRSLKDI